MASYIHPKSQAFDLHHGAPSDRRGDYCGYLRKASLFFRNAGGRLWHITAFAVPQHLGRYWGRADIGKVTLERCARVFFLFTCDALGPHEPGGPTFSGFHLHSRTGTAACKECGDASEIPVSSLLVIASAKVSKLTICITKAPGPPITFSR